MSQQSASTTGPTGHSTPHDIFVLTDEQILEIEPEAQDVSVREDVAQGDSLAVVSPTADASTQRNEPAQSPQARVPVLPEPPAWLAETMNDPQLGAEARALWEGAQKTEQEAASYREVFAKPEEARAAAERARVLDDIDRAFFNGDASQRAQLAAMMMREDPAAFREMVFEGLRALEEVGKPVRTRSVADALSRLPALTPAGVANPAPTARVSHAVQQGVDSAQQAQFAAYAAFEKAANEDLERSVGSAIERTLEQALPAAGQANGAALKGRMSAAIRQDIEKALQGDRQLGEQVAQILSGRRLDSETRMHVVRLIGERAQQLVPGATKRALNDWTHATLAAHRGKNAQADGASARREVATAASLPRDVRTNKQSETARSPRSDARASQKGRVNYGKLSDEQILDL